MEAPGLRSLRRLFIHSTVPDPTSARPKVGFGQLSRGRLWVGKRRCEQPRSLRGVRLERAQAAGPSSISSSGKGGL